MRALVLLLAAVLVACAAAPKRDLDYERIAAELAALEADPSLGELAGAERVRARQALSELSSAPTRERELRAYTAQRRVDIARAAAEAELTQVQLRQLERERDRILLEATRRDAELARLETEKLRLQSLARTEEAERARQQAADAQAESVQSYEDARAALAEAELSKQLARAQAREAELAKREAELAGAAAESLRLQLQSLSARSDARGQVMTLSGDSFASGSAALRPEARANLQRVVQFVQDHPSAQVLIEGHTDARGSANLNQVLSQRRAEAVRQALVEEGVDPGRLRAVGYGEDRPVAPNDEEAGRARNRRVEIVIPGASG